MPTTNRNAPPVGVPTSQQEQFLRPAPPAVPATDARMIGPSVSQKSFVVTWLFAWLLGVFGVDRFYLGKIGSGIAKLLTFGGLGIWWLVDIILVLAKGRDKQGLQLAGYDQYKKIAWIVTGAVTVLSMIVSGVNASNAPSDTSAAVAPVADSAAEPAVEEPIVEEPVVEEAPVDTVQSWADETFGTFAVITQTGTGDNLVTLPAGATAGIVTATHDGARNFSASVLDASNASTGQLLVNTIGAYSGTTEYGFSSFGEDTTLQITADGNWSLTIAPISAAPELVASGTGDGVYLFEGSGGKLTATHDGSRNFSIIEETGETFNMGLLVNEIGAYSGTVPLSSGPSAIVVSANGNWTLLAE
ncbi:TM2 domain-containing protein [Cryobacterium sp. M15]|uniref:TM2 domain-containing protein n=1 Tax=Cryobacterium sp. M15 TaxID=2048291 RepID=UPI001E5F8EDF|nr:TM2 domain-containing protein [Cryobacterium sp. M15]